MSDTPNHPINAQSKTSITLARDRDAYATIRGFFFQVERTVQRWLKLEPGQSLELECGEDIDFVARASVNGEWDEKRLLEQVKSWEKNITLVNCREGIANFHEHRSNNPGVELRFCLTTNARIGLERPPLFEDDKKPGIGWWRDVAARRVSEEHRHSVVKRIREKLGKCDAPSGSNADTWINFVRFTEDGTPDEWLDFIDHYEWMTGIEQPLNLSLIIQGELIEKAIATDEISAQVTYERLFVFVLRLLSTKGQKRLDAEGWKECVKKSFTAADDALLRQTLQHIQSVEGSIRAIDTRLFQLEAQVEGLTEDHLNLESRVSKVESNCPPIITIEKGQLDEMQASLRRIENDRPKDTSNSLEAERLKIEIRIEDACTLLNEGKFRTGLNRLETLRTLVLDLEDKSVRCQLESRVCGLIGFCYWRFGEMQKANDLFAKAFALQPKNVKACSNAAYGALLTNKPDEALRLANIALEFEDGHDEAVSTAVQAFHLLESKRRNRTFFGQSF